MINNLAERCCYDCDLFKWDVINLGDYQICFECLDIRRVNSQVAFAAQVALQQQELLPQVKV